MYVVTSAEMRELDRLTINAYGTPGHVLMERAGAGAAHVFWNRFPRARTRPVVIAGKGNNGGDGFVIARLLRKRDVRCDVVLLGRAGDVRGDASRSLRAFLRGRGRLIEAPESTGVTAVAKRLAASRVIIDAILGTGLNAPVRGPIAEVISLMNASALPIFAVDIPSGLDADRGQPLGTSVQAEVTATFGFPKIGQLLYPGATLAGELAVVDIGIAPEAVARVGLKTSILEADEAALLLPPRAADAHKGDAGHVAIFAGGPGKIGAAVLAAEAAARAGAGLTTVVVPGKEAAFAVSRLREIMSMRLPADRIGSFSAPPAAQLGSLLNGKASVVVGPGMGVGNGARALVHELIRICRSPLVIDADGLNCIAGDPTVLRGRPAATVLTPHPGEMSRLVGASVSDVQGDRVAIARRLARDTGACVVLKGARTIIAQPGQTAIVNMTGNPGMASGGMGDVLAGIIGALCAQGLDAASAAALGAHVHGLAADLAASHLGGQIGMLASDVIDALPRAIAATQKCALASTRHRSGSAKPAGKSKLRAPSARRPKAGRQPSA